MEIVVMIIMAMVGFSFLLRLSYHGWAGRVILCLIAALWTVWTLDYATGQSKTQIAGWLESPETMLDTAVLLTVDVAFQIWFCFLMLKQESGERMSTASRVFLAITLWVPGLLIFPVLFAVLVEIVFSMPGTNFTVIGYGMAASVAVLGPLLAAGIRCLLPERDLSLELLFLINLLIASLGIIATVNGRTASRGTDTIEWGALCGVTAILVAGTVAGYVINKIIVKKEIRKIR